jgi:6-phosphofructokinase
MRADALETMKRIGIPTAGGDTPEVNATIPGAVVRANRLKVEIIGLIKGAIWRNLTTRSTHTCISALAISKRRKPLDFN